MVRGNNGMKLSSGEREKSLKPLNNWNQYKIEVFLHQKNIKRKFNFPEASHMGGVWERMICSVRKILRALFLKSNNWFWRRTANVDGRS